MYLTFIALIVTFTKRREVACKITSVRGLQLLVRVNFRLHITSVHICTITISHSLRHEWAKNSLKIERERKKKSNPKPLFNKAFFSIFFRKKQRMLSSDLPNLAKDCGLWDHQYLVYRLVSALSTDYTNLVSDCRLIDRPYLVDWLVGLSSADLPNLVIDCGLVDLLHWLVDLLLSVWVR